MVEINSDGYTCKHTALEVYITKYIIKHASNSIGNNSHKSQAITPPKAVARRFWEDIQFWILKRSMTIEKLKITAKDNTFFWSIITKQSNNNYKECTKASQIWANKPLKEARPEIITKTSFLQKKSAIKLFNSQIHADYKKIYSTKTHTWQSYIGYISDTENTYQIIKQNFTFQKRKKKKSLTCSCEKHSQQWMKIQRQSVKSKREPFSKLHGKTNIPSLVCERFKQTKTQKKRKQKSSQPKGWSFPTICARSFHIVIRKMKKLGLKS